MSSPAQCLGNWCAVAANSDRHTRFQTSPRISLELMGKSKHVLHVVTAVIGVIAGAVLAVFTGDPTLPLVLSGGVMAAVGYWIGGVAHRRHG